ncbi:MAG: vWA domain-containing protein [Acidobacteriota bacterium]
MVNDIWGTDKYDAFEASQFIGNYLNIYLPQEQGVRLGECAVVSLKAHQVETKRKGIVKILTNHDAGQHYLDYIDPGKLVNLSVFHKPGTVDPVKVATYIYHALEQFVVIESPRLGAPQAKDERKQRVLDLAYQLLVTTRGGQGMVADLFENNVEPIEEKDAGMSYVRILCKFPSSRFGILLLVAQAVEDAIVAENIALGRVKSILHTTAKEAKEQTGGPTISIPWKKIKALDYQLMKETQNQLLMRLAEKFGSLEELQDYLESSTTNILRRKTNEEQKRKWGDMKENVEELKELGIIKESMLGPVLTRDGEDFKKFLIKNKCDLEAELRRNIRRASGGNGRLKKSGANTEKISRVRYTNRNKVVRMSEATWAADLAVPETIISAIKTSYARNKGRLMIDKDDLHIYGKRTHAPMDVCLLVDASLSMAGEKRQAACFMAQHILLTGHDKVAVITFQEMKARVAVPFTKNQRELDRGLRRIVPGGMTPLADGIMTALEEIANNKVQNPTLILITDGEPNFPLWSYDAKKDALDAAKKIKEAKLRLICIGVEANREFLEELVDIAGGKLYVIDEITKGNLIEIVKIERRVVAVGQEV